MCTSELYHVRGKYRYIGDLKILKEIILEREIQKMFNTSFAIVTSKKIIRGSGQMILHTGKYFILMFPNIFIAFSKNYRKIFNRKKLPASRGQIF